MAAAAGVSELAGGTLTAAGLANPVGPAAIASTMAVAAGTVHTGNGAFAASNGPEPPLSNLVACLALAAGGPGRFSVDVEAERTGRLVPWLQVLDRRALHVGVVEGHDLHHGGVELGSRLAPVPLQPSRQLIIELCSAARLHRHTM